MKKDKKKNKNRDKQPISLHRWRVGLLIVGAVVCVLLGGYRIYSVQSRPTATANIERHWKESYRDGNSYKERDCYALSYTVDEMRIESNLCADRILTGPTTTVLYDPDTPSSAELDGVSGIFKQALLWGGLPLFAWFALVLFGTNALEDLLEKRRTARRRDRERQYKEGRR